MREIQKISVFLLLLSAGPAAAQVATHGSGIFAQSDFSWTQSPRLEAQCRQRLLTQALERLIPAPLESAPISREWIAPNPMLASDHSDLRVTFESPGRRHPLHTGSLASVVVQSNTHLISSWNVVRPGIFQYSCGLQLGYCRSTAELRRYPGPRIIEIFDGTGARLASLNASELTPGCLLPPRFGLSVLVVGDESAAYAAIGAAGVHGAQMALDELLPNHETHGIPFSILHDDTRSRADDLPAMIDRAMDGLPLFHAAAPGLIGVLHNGISNEALSVGRIVQRRELPLITSVSSSPTVTHLAPTPGGRNQIFRTCFIDPFQAAALARFVVQRTRIQTVAILQESSSTYSTGLAAAFQREFARYPGKRIAGLASYQGGVTHFSAELGRLHTGASDTQPDALFIPGAAAEVALIAREAVASGYRGIFLGGDGWSSGPLHEGDDNSLVNRSFFTSGFLVDRAHPNSAGAQFARRFRARFREEVSDTAVLAYDSIGMFIYAADRVLRRYAPDMRRYFDALVTRDPNYFPDVFGFTLPLLESNSGRDIMARFRRSVRDELERIDYRGIAGRIGFDAEHNPVKTVYIGTVGENSLDFVEQFDP